MGLILVQRSWCPLWTSWGCRICLFKGRVSPSSVLGLAVPEASLIVFWSQAKQTTGFMLQIRERCLSLFLIIFLWCCLVANLYPIQGISGFLIYGIVTLIRTWCHLRGRS